MDKVAGGMPVVLSIFAGDSATRDCAANEISLAFSVVFEISQDVQRKGHLPGTTADTGLPVTGTTMILLSDLG